METFLCVSFSRRFRLFPKIVSNQFLFVLNHFMLNYIFLFIFDYYHFYCELHFYLYFMFNFILSVKGESLLLRKTILRCPIFIFYSVFHQIFQIFPKYNLKASMRKLGFFAKEDGSILLCEYFFFINRKLTNLQTIHYRSNYANNGTRLVF